VPDATPRGSDTAARNGDYQRYLGGRVAGHLNASGEWNQPISAKTTNHHLISRIGTKRKALILMYVFLFFACQDMAGLSTTQHGVSVFCIKQSVNVCLLPPVDHQLEKPLAHPGTLPISS